MRSPLLLQRISRRDPGAPNALVVHDPKSQLPNWAAASTEAVSDSVPWEEASHVALGNAELGTRSEVARESTTYPADRSRVSEGTGAGTEEGLAVAGEPGSTGEDIRSRPYLSTEVTGEAYDTLTTFWDALRAAGYDVW